MIRAEDLPTPTIGPARAPGSGRQARSEARPATSGDPAEERPPGVYVYREGDERPGGPAGRPGKDDAAYWYDDLSTEAAPAPAEQTRGPFEPLVSSSDPPGTVRSAAPDAGAGGTQAGGGPDEQDGSEDPEPAQERKLEQIKDLYLTAQAIGEDNVGKHFDQLLAQQRELISDFFKQSGKHGRPVPPEGRPAPPDGDAPPTPPEGAGVGAEPPAW